MLLGTVPAPPDLWAEQTECERRQGIRLCSLFTKYRQHTDANVVSSEPESTFAFRKTPSAVRKHRTNSSVPHHLARGERGFYRLVPPRARVGDRLCLILVAKRLSCLRPIEVGKREGHDGQELHFVGECYAHGFLDGEGEGLTGKGQLEARLSRIRRVGIIGAVLHFEY